MTGIEPLRALCLRDLATWTEHAPDQTALLAPGKPPVSYSALINGIARVAQVLRHAGVRPGDVVAVAIPDSPDLFTALLGALEVAAVAPLDWQLTEAECRSRLTLLRARVLLSRSGSDGHGAAVARTLGIPVIELGGSENFTNIRQVPIRVPEECAMVLQTSGTSGEPKLVPLTHANLYAMGTAVRNGLDVRAEDRYISIMPLYHILGFSSALGQLMAGGSVACTGFDARRFPAWIEELSPTWYAAGPALHRTILEMAQEDPEPFRRSRLRFVRCGSGAGSPALLNDLERVLQVEVINGYGLTEVGCATNTPPRSRRKTGSAGRTIGLEIATMDAHGNLLTPGSEGEVVLRGDAVMPGYLDAEEANREVFVNGWFRSGDFGHLDQDGDLFITGRIKEVINRGGETISPLEIDHALAEHPAIKSAASFGVAHPTLGEDIVAAVVLRPGARAVASEIRTFLAERLSRSKVPGRVWFVETLLLSASGKPLRDSLHAQFQASARVQESPASGALDDEATTLLRQRIGAIWIQILHSDVPNAEDNFFAMGGDSLSAARMFALIGSEFQIHESALDLATFLDSPTFLHLVQVVAKRTDGGQLRFEDVSAVCLQSSGNSPPLFFIPGEGAEPWSLLHLARCLGDRQPFFALRHRIGDPAEFPDIASRFAKLISLIRPTGTIVLAGHCYGGILAFEIAQRLLAMSRSDVAVVLIDVDTPGYPKARVTRYVTYLPTVFRAALRGQARNLAAELAGHFQYIRALREKKRSYQQLRGGPSPSPSGDAPGSTAPSSTAPSSLSPGGIVMRSYRPQPFTGSIANVLASDRPAGTERVLQDPRKGWRDFARGPFHERSLSGSHESILDAENAPALARFIASSLPGQNTSRERPA